MEGKKGEAWRWKDGEREENIMEKEEKKLEGRKICKRGGGGGEAHLDTKIINLA